MYSVRPAPWQRTMNVMQDKVLLDALRADSAVAKRAELTSPHGLRDALRADSTGIRNTRPKRRVSAKTPKMMNATMV